MESLFARHKVRAKELLDLTDERLRQVPHCIISYNRYSVISA